MHIMKKQKFKIHIIDGYISSVILIEYPDRILCVDSGSRPDVRLINEFVTEKLSRSMTDIRLCVITHMHPDHAGGAAALKKNFGIPLAAHEGINDWYTGPWGWIQNRIDLMSQQRIRRIRKMPCEPVRFPRSLDLDHELDNREPLPSFGDWIALHVPGHTSHDIAIYNEEARAICTGDCVINIRGKFVLPIPVLFEGRMIKSLKKMAELDVTTMVPSHGPVVSGDNIRSIFLGLIPMIGLPKNKMSRRGHNLARFSPEVWRAYWKKLKRRALG
jgi:glyoxylase-like metal-dependent hydrolase (beta-lactamase superfamily II)